ncbi:MAG: SIMPL domain-containing protein [Burkholderiaceae bacterium]
MLPSEDVGNPGRCGIEWPDAMRRRRLLLGGAGLGGLLLAGQAPVVLAQTLPAPDKVVNLSASSFVEVPQDWLTMRLNTTREASDAVTVQNELKVALEGALRVAREAEQGDDLQVRTGQFSLSPRYGSQSRIQGWRGVAELILEGRDVARIARTAGRIQSLTTAHVAFSLSRQARQKLEADVQMQAIERFRARAADITRAFGLQSYELREVSVSSTDEGVVPVRSPVMAMEMRAAASDAAVPVEPGRSTVSITVSGSIQMR